MRIIFLIDALGCTLGILLFPVSRASTGTPPQIAFLDVYESQSWGLIPQATNIVIAILVLFAFSLPQLKGFVTQNFIPIISVVGTILFNCWVLMSAMHDPSRPYRGAFRSFQQVSPLPPSLTCSFKRSLAHSFTLPPYRSLPPPPLSPSPSLPLSPSSLPPSPSLSPSERE